MKQNSAFAGFLTRALQKPIICDYISRLYDLGYSVAEVSFGFGVFILTVSSKDVPVVKVESTSLFMAYSQAHQAALSAIKPKQEAA